MCEHANVFPSARADVMCVYTVQRYMYSKFTSSRSRTPVNMFVVAARSRSR